MTTDTTVDTGARGDLAQLTDNEIDAVGGGIISTRPALAVPLHCRVPDRRSKPRVHSESMPTTRATSSGANKGVLTMKKARYGWSARSDT